MDADLRRHDEVEAHCNGPPGCPRDPSPGCRRTAGGRSPEVPVLVWPTTPRGTGRPSAPRGAENVRAARPDGESLRVEIVLP